MHAFLKPAAKPLLFVLVIGVLAIGGCSDDSETVREIQARRQQRLQAESKQDHLGETFLLLSKLVELNRERADRQIIYHLNQWRQVREGHDDLGTPTSLLKNISNILPDDAVTNRVTKEQFVAADVDHLRDCYLNRQVIRWIDSPRNDDPLLADWLKSKEPDLEGKQFDQLRSACRIFDWTVRNIALEPDVPPGMQPPNLPMPFNMRINGVGYRQTDYQSLWRGTGDALQRAGVFTQLCRQASIPAAILATQSTENATLTPWCVGILIGEEVYLFEPKLGTFVPGPDQTGIATLKQARKDALITRRLSVAGFDEFEYPFSMSDVQQCTALLNLLPEAISPRMRLLQNGLTGDRRMQVFADADAEAKQWDEASGISGVRIWDVPLKAEIYAKAMEKQSELDPMFAFWHLAKWSILDGGDGSSRQLSLGRWRHLHGQFADDKDENTEGARTIYMTLRAPEFEIQDMAIDPELQKKYFRRELGLTPEQYRQQLAQIQIMMRLGKRTASYWLSLVQYDDDRLETAANWLSKRVLIESQQSHWEPAARYNLARTQEQLNDSEKAIELYKTSGDPQEQGNRIRARLLSKSDDS
ncbi:MAG: hypothetical protein WBD20_17320 [Pirellulaceae bacterium]